MGEEKRIMDMLGRSEQDGDVKGSHLGKILMYLKRTREENFDETVSKLALIVGMSARNIRENYLKGIIYFGIIKTGYNGNMLRWKWIGENSLNGLDLSEIPKPSLQDTIEKNVQSDSKAPFTEAVGEHSEKVAPPPEKKIKKKKHICKNCGKVIKKNRIYCNEKCLREYLKKRKKGGK